MARIVIYSGGDRQDNEPIDLALFQLTGKKNPRMLFIPSEEEHGEEDFEDFCYYYGYYGIKSFDYLSLESFVYHDGVTKILNNDIVYLSGGNTFSLLSSLRKSGMINYLKNYALEMGVLAGESAGGIVLTPNIHSATYPEFDKDENEIDLKVMTGLKLLPFEFFPHFQNTRRYIHALNSKSRFLNHPIFACTDGSGIVVNDEMLSFHGKVWGFFRGKKFKLT
jgi:dipeptidase E